MCVEGEGEVVEEFGELSGRLVAELVGVWGGRTGSQPQLRDGVFEVLGVDGARVLDGGDGQGVVGDAVDEPWQSARALGQRLDGGRFEQGGTSQPARRRRCAR